MERAGGGTTGWHRSRVKVAQFHWKLVVGRAVVESARANCLEPKRRGREDGRRNNGV